MINGTLFKREVKANYKLLLIFMLVLSLYGGMLTSMFDPKLGDSLKQMAESMPQIFAAVGMMNTASTLIEFLANYLYGFLLVAFPLVFIIILSNHLVAKYVAKGSMAYILSTPNKRVKIIMTQGITLLAGVILLVLYVTGLCIVLGQALFPGDLDISKFILLNVGWLGLLVFLSGFCFFSSCIFNDTKMSYGVSAGFTIAFVLIQMISNIGDKFEWLKYLTPLTLFNAENIIAGKENSILYFIILYIAGIVFYGLGMGIFSKRDLPV